MKISQDVPQIQWKETSWVSFLLIFLLNFALKYNGTSDTSIWLDESYSYFKAIGSPSEILFHSNYDLGNPPLYYIILHYWGLLFGYDAFGLRLLSLIASSLTAGVLYITGSRIFDKKAGWIAALLFTFSTQHVYYAQEIRSYALLTLLLSISVLFFVRFLYARHFSFRMIFEIALLNAALMYINYAAMFFPIAQLIAVLFLRYRQGLIKAFSISAIISVILYLPQVWYFVYIYKNANIEALNWWVEIPKIDHFFHFWKFYWSYLWLPALILFAFAILVSFKKRSFQINQLRHLRLLLFFFIATLVINFIFSQFFISLFLPRYLVCYTVILCLLFGGMASIYWHKWWINLLTVSMVFIAAFTSDYSPSNGENWKEATDYYLSNPKVSETQLFILPYAGRYAVFFYLYSKEQNQLLAKNKKVEEHFYSGNGFAEFQHIPLQGAVIISSSNYVSLEDKKKFWELFQDAYTIEDYKSFGEIDYFYLKHI